MAPQVPTPPPGSLLCQLDGKTTDSGAPLCQPYEGAWVLLEWGRGVLGIPRYHDGVGWSLRGPGDIVPNCRARGRNLVHVASAGLQRKSHSPYGLDNWDRKIRSPSVVLANTADRPGMRCPSTQSMYL